MSRTYRIVGPPGTGKTTELAARAKGAVAKYGADAVLVGSLTNAAASEAAGRDTGLRREQVGTLHSHCYRAIGAPRVAAGPLLDAWNERCLERDAWRSWRLTRKGGRFEPSREAEPGEGDGGATIGDELMSAVDLHRAALRPRALWTETERLFYDAWCEFKSDADCVDFTDMVERALEGCDTAPGRPAVLLFDEYQDHSALEIALIDKWLAALGVEAGLVVGDPFQALFGWRGASPDAFTGKIDRVLSQSWRVPRAAHARALALIRQASTYDERLQYRPTDVEGEVTRSPATWKQPEPLLRLAERAVAEGDGPVMFLASCEYQLRPLLRVLREAGVPYHNPYTTRWNPIGRAQRDDVRSLLSAAATEFGGDADREPSALDLKRVDKLLRSESLWRRGGRAALSALPDGVPQDAVLAFVREWMAPDAQRALWGGDLAWLHAEMTKVGQTRAEFPLAVVRRGGLPALAAEPSVVVGTVHSVKGGEAPTVVVFPDLSPGGALSYARRGWYGRDSVLRQFYVALTRTSRRLVLCEPARGSEYVPL